MRRSSVIGHPSSAKVCSCRRPSTASRRPGFSLIEVMIVVVIIALMAGVVTLATRSYLDRAKRARAKADIAVYVQACESFFLDTGKYPDNSQGLKTLAPKYVTQIKLDPWGRPYGYVAPGKTTPYDITCYAADGREGGTGADVDLTQTDIDTPAKPGN